MPDFLHCIDLTDLFCSDAVNFQALKLFWQVALTPSGYMIDSTGILGGYCITPWQGEENRVR